ncbi:ankyrin repeat domain-containing protein [Undibacterium sp. YM2]|uniref:ankyrin repeat domain-containing protein n=1 Tax=Undibacterium sp. YM2 TaxID=2058625 RepID=UPI00138A51F1|nr:ankyrin repeat domain-containing protein [Undibacterium sp. YM2]
MRRFEPIKTPVLLRTIHNNSANLIEEVKQIIAQETGPDHIAECEKPALRVLSYNGRFDVVKLLLDAGAKESELNWTDVMQEVAFGTTASLKQKIEETGDLETADFLSRTPFLIAALLGDIEKARLLLKLGANREAVGFGGRNATQYAVQTNQIPMLTWLLEEGFSIEATDNHLNTPLILAAELGLTDCVKFLLERGADISKGNHIPYRAIRVAKNLDIVDLLVKCGEDINDISSQMHANLLGIKHNASPVVPKDDYLNGRYREFGTGNAIKTNKPFWLAMIRSGASAWRANEMFHDEGSHDGNIIWCYQRFGRTTTILPDGRIIEIGGEHEDFYDPDFCIYNDVCVFEKNGNINIYSYSAEIFPPTDFHTATLVDEDIYIIGRLGYPETRVAGFTPVYKLDTKSLQISRFDTTGDKPGFISHHKAKLKDGKILVSGGKQIILSDGKEDYIDNTENFQLCLKTGVWSVA